MKQKLSITMEEKVVEDILKLVEEGRYRNKSHIVEYAVRRLLRGEE